MKNRPFWDCNSNFQKHTKHKSDHRRKQICLNCRNVFLNIVQERAPSCEKRVKLPFFLFFSRPSCGLVVGKLLLLENEYPQYIICIKSERITSGRRSFSLVVDVASFIARIAKVANATPLSQLLPLIMILDASNKFLAILLLYLRPL